MKIYAIMMTYDQMDWLPYSIDQFNIALDAGAIDKVLIAEGSHSKQAPARSPDGSWDYLQDRVGNDPRYQIFDSKPFRDSAPIYGKAQAPLLHHMCSTIPLDDDVWIWGIHDDEFFFNSFLENIRNIAIDAKNKGKEMVVTKQMGFTFNMKLYWRKRTIYMLFSWKKGNFWKPITSPCYPNGTKYLDRKDKIIFDKEFDHTTFHFLFVKRPKRQEYRHSILPTELKYDKPAIFHREIWEKADLNNLEASYKKYQSIMGGYGFYKDAVDLGPEIYQTLKTYGGPYPEVLQGHPYMDIDDVRKLK